MKLGPEQQNLEKLILNIISECVTYLDKDFSIKWANKAACDLIGKDFEEIKNMKCYEVWYKQHSLCKDCPAVSALEWKETCTSIKKTLDGRYWSITAYPVWGEDEGLEGLIVTNYDITTQKNIELELREQKEKFSAITNNMLDIISMTDSNGIINYVSPSIKPTLGYEPKELIGRSVFEFLHPDDKEIIEGVFLEAINNRSSGREEFRFIDNEGNYRWLEATGNVIVDEDGNIKNTVFASRDITKRKEAEAKVRRLSFYDNLTGLYNRVYLEEEMNRLDTKRQLPISVIMLDVNGLKLVNDAYGHSMGDDLLISAGQVLKKACRKEDLIGRWGGDEFVILLTQTPMDMAEQITERIKQECDKTIVGSTPLSISFGVATKETEAEDLDDILNDAEVRMYKNKLAESSKARNKIIYNLINDLREKSNETEEHAWRLTKLVFDFGIYLNLVEFELERLTLLASVHDIGKIVISENILQKDQADLTEEEKETLKKHPEAGYQIARSSENLVHIASEILTHHENWDGTGYPRQLKGKNIPLLSRIIAVVGTYEKLINEGAPGTKYKQEAIRELNKLSGSRLDPTLVERFLEFIKEGDKKTN
ncbi:diguanylate cyclase domain-containing protein [Natranaerofaba carboxydovora]|uniref:diguanylate cyclase domain-containing protein n=1 Tax=Natranaerofaba carboxydovora TaxID=2742683 RepID=UPI001F136EA4|nr:diguanylate cyclase [Natranaerofaba carboxydovora]UMZ72701.1 putative diguanylate cyclase YdaM [Natranaerofaba carboxydovora]